MSLGSWLPFSLGEGLEGSPDNIRSYVDFGSRISR